MSNCVHNKNKALRWNCSITVYNYNITHVHPSLKKHSTLSTEQKSFKSVALCTPCLSGRSTLKVSLPHRFIRLCCIYDRICSFGAFKWITNICNDRWSEKEVTLCTRLQTHRKTTGRDDSRMPINAQSYFFSWFANRNLLNCGPLFSRPRQNARWQEC